MNRDELLTGIVDANRQREDTLLSRYACRSAAAVRLDPHREKTPCWENVRPAFFHDADKILHSLAYTRYIDKTQVFYLFDNDHVTHRVLHVQFVSKIARTIARCLRLNEDLVEAIALGHDIGHVPFGHDGERFLNEICVSNGIGGFCHNAQSVRWLLELENGGLGVNLCLQTIDGILAHNGEMLTRRLEPDREKTWDTVLEEYRTCMMDSAFSKRLRPMTLEGCVMRIADIIGYVGRDLEDAITLEVITRDELPPEAVGVLGDTNSSIINTLVMDLIEQSAGGDAIGFSEPVFSALGAMIRFNLERIYHNPRVRERDEKLRRLFQVIYEGCLSDLAARTDGADVVEFHRKLADTAPAHHRDTPPARVVVDFIAGMTDTFFLAKAQEHLLPAGFGLKAPAEEKEGRPCF
jgi:dGTPase